MDLSAQEGINYDESLLPAYTLPDPLIFPGGKKVKTLRQWETKRKPQLFRMFEDQMFGKIPEGLRIKEYRLLEESENTPYPNGRRKQVALVLKKAEKELLIHLLLYLPKGVEKAPVFLGYNFKGNHSVTPDKAVIISSSWARDDAASGITGNRFSEESRGSGASSWSIQRMLNAGYGVAVLYYGDVDPDRDDFSDGVHPFCYSGDQKKPLPGGWGAIAAWSWGLSQALNYLETEPAVDAGKVIVFGHSRLGKTALWAGVTDPRFAMVISNNSGCGGAALSKRIYGETVKRINTSFPHWFCDNFKQYNDREQDLPFDQHELIALIAPRPVYIASALEDRWADPKGEYLGGYYASPIYHLYGKKGLESAEQPPVGMPVMNQIGYHIRPGGHGVTDFDWEQYIRFADYHLK